MRRDGVRHIAWIALALLPAALACAVRPLVGDWLGRAEAPASVSSPPPGPALAAYVESEGRRFGVLVGRNARGPQRGRPWSVAFSVDD